MEFSKGGIDLIRACEQFLAMAKRKDLTEADVSMASLYVSDLHEELLSSYPDKAEFLPNRFKKKAAKQ